MLSSISSSSHRDATSDVLDRAEKGLAASALPEHPELQTRRSLDASMAPRAEQMSRGAANSPMIVIRDEAALAAHEAFMKLAAPTDLPALQNALVLAQAGRIDVNNQREREKYKVLSSATRTYAKSSKDHIANQEADNKQEASRRLLGPLASVMLDLVKALEPTPVVRPSADAAAGAGASGSRSPQEADGGKPSSATIIGNMLNKHVDILKVIANAERNSNISERSDLVTLDFKNSELPQRSVKLALKHGVEPILRLIESTAPLGGALAQRHLHCTLDELAPGTPPESAVLTAVPEPAHITAQVLQSAVTSANKGFGTYLRKNKICATSLAKHGMTMTQFPELKAALRANSNLPSVESTSRSQAEPAETTASPERA